MVRESNPIAELLTFYVLIGISRTRKRIVPRDALKSRCVLGASRDGSQRMLSASQDRSRRVFSESQGRIRHVLSVSQDGSRCVLSASPVCVLGASQDGSRRVLCRNLRYKD